MVTPTTSPLARDVRRLNQLDLDCIADIKRWLNKFRFDPAYRGKGKRVPLRQFADYCAVSRQTLYDLVRGERKGIERTTRDRIYAAIDLVEQHGLRFERIVIRKPVVERRVIVPGIIAWQPVMPNGAPPPPIPQRHITEKQLAARPAAAERLRKNRGRVITVVGP